MEPAFFHGQKPTIHGQNGMEAVFTVCYGHSKQSLHDSYLYTESEWRENYETLLF